MFRRLPGTWILTSGAEGLPFLDRAVVGAQGRSCEARVRASLRLTGSFQVPGNVQDIASSGTEGRGAAAAMSFPVPGTGLPRLLREALARDVPDVPGTGKVVVLYAPPAMRALVLERPGPAASAPLAERDVPAPAPAAGELLVRVAACAVCRTDLQLCEGDLQAHRLPIVPGHQIVGTVEELGESVTGFARGDRVGVTWLAGSCNACDRCREGRENLCRLATFTGWDRDGGFAELATVRADVAVPLPPALEDIAAAPLLCGGVIGYRSLRVSGIQPGGRLGLFGFGASARCAIQVAVSWGCEVHVCTRSAAERDRARELGAAWAGGYDEAPPVPLDAAITFAPAGDVVVTALRAVDRGGTVAINAIHLDRVPEFPYDLLWWERSIRSVANVTRRDAREFVALAAGLPVRTDAEVHPLGDANIALQRVADGTVRGAAVLVP